MLTATYPDMFREDLGRKVCVRFPNGGESPSPHVPLELRRAGLQTHVRCSVTRAVACEKSVSSRTDGWFNVVGQRCAFGATVDGCGGDGDDEVGFLAAVPLAASARCCCSGYCRAAATPMKCSLAGHAFALQVCPSSMAHCQR